MRKKFEYKQSTCWTGDLIDFLNDQGQTGWELIYLEIKDEHARIIFKREV